MIKALFIMFGLLATAEASFPTSCHQQVLDAIKSGEALEELARRGEMSTAQLKYLLENPATADRTQSYLIACHLKDRGYDLARTLYVRSQGTTKYAATASTVLRLREWVTTFNYWTPFYRPRTRLFPDSLASIGETLPSPMMDSFTNAFAKVEEPGYVRGLRTLVPSLKKIIEVRAKEDFSKLKSETADYAKATKWQLSGSVTPKHVQELLEGEVFNFIYGLPYIPAGEAELKEAFSGYRSKNLAKHKHIPDTVLSILLKFHADNSPQTFEEFARWFEETVERLLNNEREKLIAEWQKTLKQGVVQNEPKWKQQNYVPPPKKPGGVISSAPPVEFSEVDLTPAILIPPKSNKPGFRVLKRDGARETDEATDDTKEREVLLSGKAEKDKERLSVNEALEGQINKTLDRLKENHRHPSLNTHPYEDRKGICPGYEKIWVSWVNQDHGGYRMLWVFRGNDIWVLRIVHNDEQ